MGLPVDQTPSRMVLYSSIFSLLESDHAELDGLLHDTKAAIERADVDRTFEHLDFFWARLAMHIRAEHRWLFPAVRTVAERSLADLTQIPGILETLRHDHDFFMFELARAIKAMRLVFPFGNEKETLVVVRELLEAVSARLEGHNCLEEEWVYTVATPEFLDPTEIEQLLCSIRKELNNYPQRSVGKRQRLRGY